MTSGQSAGKKSNWKMITSDHHFRTQLSVAAAKRLVIAYFYSITCTHCTRMTPVVQQLAATFDRSLVLQVDVTKCPNTVGENKIRYTPTCLLYHNKEVSDRVDGEEPEQLESKVRQFYADEQSGSDSTEPKVRSGPLKNLRRFINTTACDCVNNRGDAAIFDDLFAEAMLPSSRYLESKPGSWLVVFVSFFDEVCINSIRVRGPTDHGPKAVKLFVNQPHRVCIECDPDDEDDDDNTPHLAPTEVVRLTPDDLSGERPDVKLLNKTKAFEAVKSVTLFIEENQMEYGVIRVRHIGFVGRADEPEETKNDD